MSQNNVTLQVRRPVAGKAPVEVHLAVFALGAACGVVLTLWVIGVMAL